MILACPSFIFLKRLASPITDAASLTLRHVSSNRVTTRTAVPSATSGELRDLLETRPFCSLPYDLAQPKIQSSLPPTTISAPAGRIGDAPPGLVPSLRTRRSPWSRHALVRAPESTLARCTSFLGRRTRTGARLLLLVYDASVLQDEFGEE